LHWKNWPYHVPSGIIDIKVVRVTQPHHEAWQYVTGRNKWGIKYEIVCSIGDPCIIWLAGPFKGSAADSTIASSSGIKLLLQNECLLADRAYRGDLLSFLVPLPGHRLTHDPDQKAQNYLFHSARVAIERVIQRFSTFYVFCGIWRATFLLHKKCAKVVCKLLNLFFDYEPLG
jgi:hypothetical protein